MSSPAQLTDPIGPIDQLTPATRDAARQTVADPDAVAHHADWPVNENDKHARELHLVGVRASLAARVSGDPEFYDARLAGWWVWGICAHIGGGYADGNGPWVVRDGLMVDSRLDDASNAGEGHDALLDYGWTAHAWRTAGGYGGGRGGQGDLNRHKERVYFSPACIAEDGGLFDLLDGAAS